MRRINRITSLFYRTSFPFSISHFLFPLSPISLPYDLQKHQTGSRRSHTGSQALRGFRQAVRGLRQALRGLKQVLRKALRGTRQALRQAVRGFILALRGLRQALRGLRQALRGLRQALKGLRQALGSQKGYKRPQTVLNGDCLVWLLRSSATASSTANITITHGALGITDNIALMPLF